MGVTKETLFAGNGTDFPKKDDTVTMEYTGWLFDPSKPEKKGSQYVLQPPSVDLVWLIFY
jgi:FK506-binding protein 1